MSFELYIVPTTFIYLILNISIYHVRSGELITKAFIRKLEGSMIELLGHCSWLNLIWQVGIKSLTLDESEGSRYRYVDS